MPGFVANLLARMAHAVAPKTVSKLAINQFARAARPRPRPFSLWSHRETEICDYTSWPGLTDREFSGRHLRAAPASYVAGLPPDSAYVSQDDHGQVTGLFERKTQLDCPRSSLLFPFFAQWFTDSFLRTHPTDRRKNTSNHDIDLCQIYGLTESTANLLRTHEGGRLRSQTIDGEEYPDDLFDAAGQVKPEYRELPYVTRADGAFLTGLLSKFGDPEARKHKFFATGLERGNSSVGYTAVSTLFLREHNRLCRELASRHSDWDDERLFQTARMINIVMLLKIVIEEYINHIAPVEAPIFLVDPSFPEDESWYRTNWMSLEFDLLYRWHGLIPDTMVFDGQSYAPPEFLMNNALLIARGVGSIIDSASRQRAGRISLHNTAGFLLEAEYQAIKMGRDYRLCSFNDYRSHFSMDKLEDFDELTSDPALARELQALYGDIGNLEFFVGLFAEEPEDGALFGTTMTTLVAHDAFTQALTNPLLSKNVFGPATFSSYGMDEIGNTSSLGDLVARNLSGASSVRMSFRFES